MRGNGWGRSASFFKIDKVTQAYCLFDIKRFKRNKSTQNSINYTETGVICKGYETTEASTGDNIRTKNRNYYIPYEKPKKITSLYCKRNKYKVTSPSKREPEADVKSQAELEKKQVFRKLDYQFNHPVTNKQGGDLSQNIVKITPKPKKIVKCFRGPCSYAYECSKPFDKAMTYTHGRRNKTRRNRHNIKENEITEVPNYYVAAVNKSDNKKKGKRIKKSFGTPKPKYEITENVFAEGPDIHQENTKCKPNSKREQKYKRDKNDNIYGEGASDFQHNGVATAEEDLIKKDYKSTSTITKLKDKIICLCRKYSKVLKEKCPPTKQKRTPVEQKQNNNSILAKTQQTDAVNVEPPKCALARLHRCRCRHCGSKNIREPVSATKYSVIKSRFTRKISSKSENWSTKHEPMRHKLKKTSNALPVRKWCRCSQSDDLQNKNKRGLKISVNQNDLQLCNCKERKQRIKNDKTKNVITLKGKSANENITCKCTCNKKGLLSSSLICFSFANLRQRSFNVIGRKKVQDAAQNDNKIPCKYCVSHKCISKKAIKQKQTVKKKNSKKSKKNKSNFLTFPTSLNQLQKDFGPLTKLVNKKKKKETRKERKMRIKRAKEREKMIKMRKKQMEKWMQDQRKKEKQKMRSCRHTFIHTLRTYPCVWVFHMCPQFYPRCIGLLSFWKQVIHFLLFTIAVVVWTPGILCCHMCHKMFCCIN